MPIYAYRCESCGFAQDVLQKRSDPVLELCPSCGAARFRKQLSAPAFQLKGSGWYVTDFRGGGAPAGDKAEKTDKTEKTDAKPADAAAAPAAAPAPAPAPAPAQKSGPSSSEAA